MARGWKRAVEAVLARSGVARWAEGRRRPSTVILAYHNIVPTGEDAVGDVGLHVDRSTFADQLDWLLEGRPLVSLEGAFHASEGDDATRIVITFDDAYRGTMTAGMEELEKRGVPSTVFVPPGLLGTDGFWWDRLAPSGGGPLDPLVREHALTELQGRQDRILSWAHAEGLGVNEMPEHARPVDERVLEPGDLPSGTTLGAHTWSHPNLTALSREHVRTQLVECRDWLSRRTDRYVDWLAYPYGLADDGVEKEASEHFDGALLVAGGASVVKGHRIGGGHSIPRINVARGLSLEGLASRLAGIGA